MANTINVTDLAVIVAGAITTGQQVTIYDQSGNAGRAAIEDVVAAGRVSPLLDTVIIPVGTTAVTSEETLYTGPTGRWEVGETRRISASFTTNANNHVKTIKLKFDGVVVYNSATASPTDTTPNDARVLVEFDALRVSTTLARVKGMATISNSGSVSAVAVGDITGLAGAVNVVVTITGQNGTATVDDIVLEYVTIVKVN
jgi:hypothetical protein